MMAKRMTDTEKWKDDWFLGLSPSHKLLWFYILDNCDHAGIWKVSERLASALIGESADLLAARDAFGSRVSVLNNGDYWRIEKFVSFQYGNLSNLKSTVALGVRRRLSELGLDPDDGNPSPTLTEGLAKGCVRVQEQEQEKEKDKEKVLGRPKGTVDELFEQFWALYPRKTAKQAAHKAYLKLNPHARAQALIAVVWQARSPEHLMKEQQYTPHAATWLNQGRYDDPRPNKGGPKRGLDDIAS
jgi:hypothetical protein